MTDSLLKGVIMENFVRNITALFLAKVAGIIANWATRVAKNGMVRIEIMSLPTNVDWDAAGGAILLFLGLMVFWFITPA